MKVDMPTNYSEGAHHTYRCSACKVQNVKLWREWNTFLSHQKLLCLKCGCKQEKTERFPTEDGKSLHDGKIQYWYQHDNTMWAAHGRFQFWQGWSGVPGEEPTGPNIRFDSNYQQCDQLGGLCPAIPTVEGDTFWGYTSVPQDGCEWWYRLPYYPVP